MINIWSSLYSSSDKILSLSSEYPYIAIFRNSYKRTIIINVECNNLKDILMREAKIRKIIKTAQ